MRNQNYAKTENNLDSKDFKDYTDGGTVRSRAANKKYDAPNDTTVDLEPYGEKTKEIVHENHRLDSQTEINVSKEEL